MVTMKGHPAPFVLIQWGDPSKWEADEFKKIQSHFEYDGFRISGRTDDHRPPICEVRVDSDSKADFIGGLRAALAANPDCQCIYISAHGNLKGLWWSHESNALVSYNQVGDIFRESRSKDPIMIVFGTCMAMDPRIAVEYKFPNKVYEIAGFTVEPRFFDVAGLAADVLVDHVRLVYSLKDPRPDVLAHAKERTGKITPSARDIVESGIILHSDSIGENVLNAPGGKIVFARRDPITHSWSREERDLGHLSRQ